MLAPKSGGRPTCLSHTAPNIIRVTPEEEEEELVENDVLIG